MREKGNLSYVEVIGITVVLSVAAMTFVPKFTRASRESMTCDLIDGLHQMRSQLDLYCAQHGDCLPPVDSFESFKTHMTRKVGQFGPYVEKVPVNPFNNLNTIRFDDKPQEQVRPGGGLIQGADCSNLTILPHMRFFRNLIELGLLRILKWQAQV